MADRAQGFGAKLRAARERRGVSLREIANKTKITVSALEALERNDFSRLPGGIFSRAFVRSYATEVGLDPEETIQEFLAQFPRDASVSAGHPRAAEPEDGEALESDRRIAMTFLRLVGISIPLIGIVLYFSSGVRHRSPAEPPSTMTPPPAASVEQPAEVPPAAPAVASDATADASARPDVPAAEPATATDQLTVVLSAARPCWVSATVDGIRAFDRLLQPGDERTLDVRRELLLTAGDAAALSITLNGAPAKPLGRSGEVVTARFNLANFKDYLAER